MNDNKASIVNYNIALKKSGLNPALVEIEKVKGILINHTKEISPIVSQFPGMLILADPKNQLTIVFQNEIIIVSDSSTEVDQTRATRLAAVANDLDEALKESLDHYAFNYSYTFEFDSPATAASFTRYFNGTALTESTLATDASKVEFVSLSIGEEVDNTYIRTNITARLDKDNKPTSLVDVQRSIQVKETTLGAITDLANNVIQRDEQSRGLKAAIEPAQIVEGS